MSDERYTLEEARRELAQRECMAHGHEWRVVTSGAGVPTAVFCERCGQNHKVAT